MARFPIVADQTATGPPLVAVRQPPDNDEDAVLVLHVSAPAAP